jgi:hypothetical protein
MALNPASLIQGLTVLFSGPAQSPQAAATQMANLYAAYAALGVFGASTPVFTGSEKQLLASTLAQTFSTPGPNPAAFGTVWSKGLTAFWLTPPIVVAGVQSGVVTAIPGAATLPASLGALVAIPSNSPATAASKLANALHTATQTVVATVAPPPGTVVPIT